MRYVMPPDHAVLDLLTEDEYDNAPTDQARIMRGRAKAWANHRASGPTGKLRTLSQSTPGNSVLLEGYLRSAQVSAIVTAVAAAEGVHFKSKVERSLVDDSIIGVRVTLVAFTR